MLKEKIKSLSELKGIAKCLKKNGKKIVFTNGCFDLMHYGHVHYLEQAKQKGDVLIVGINSDSSVERLKGPARPIVSQRYRLRVVAGLESVDYVVLFNEDSPLKVIQSICPDILVKGGDWQKKEIIGSDFVVNNGGRVLTIKFVKGLSTTSLIKNIAQGSGK